VYLLRDKDEVLLVDYQKKGKNITPKYYDSLLDKLKQKLSLNIEANFRKEICFFKTMLHKATSTYHTLADIHFKILKRSAYSTGFVRPDYYLFPNLKIYPKGGKYSSIREATLAAYR
jgi:hypothetical protein